MHYLPLLLPFQENLINQPSADTMSIPVRSSQHLVLFTAKVETALRHHHYRSEDENARKDGSFYGSAKEAGEVTMSRDQLFEAAVSVRQWADGLRVFWKDRKSPPNVRTARLMV